MSLSTAAFGFKWKYRAQEPQNGSMYREKGGNIELIVGSILDLLPAQRKNFGPALLL